MKTRRKYVLTLSVELDEAGFNHEQFSPVDVEDYLKETLFEVCEDWVLRNQEPDLDFNTIEIENKVKAKKKVKKK